MGTNKKNISFEKAIKEFEKLNNNYEKNKELNIEDIKKILQHDKKLYYLTDIIFNEKKEEIINGEDLEIYNNLFLYSTIYAYADLNNIEIKDLDLDEIFDDIALDETIISNDNVSAYINEIRDYKLLTREEEVMLFKKLERGDNKARNIIIKSNLKLVISIAKKYTSSRLPFLDLIQEGNIGLMKAVDKFDYHRGNKFSTFATYWIRQTITRAIANKSREIRYPVNTFYIINNIELYINGYYSQYYEYPSLEQIANKFNITTKKASEYVLNISSTISYNLKVGEEQDTEFRDLIASKDNVEEEVLSKNINKDINLALDILNERERDIIELRFGLNGRKKLTLVETAKLYGITRERIRQIESMAIKKLRGDSAIKYLEGYYDLYKDDNDKENIYTYFSNLGFTYKTTRLLINTLDENTKKILYKKFRFSDYRREDIKQELSEEEEKMFTNEILPSIIEKLEEIQNNYKNESTTKRERKKK